MAASAQEMAPWQVYLASGSNRLSHDHRAGRWNSVCSGAGGYGTRISMEYASSVPVSITNVSNSLCINERENMQDLNDRFASYLEKVHQLEAANAQLELQIKEHLERSSLGDCKDMGGHLGMIDNLQNQISEWYTTHAQLRLQVANTQLEVYDYKYKCEQEERRLLAAEAELSHLQSIQHELIDREGDLHIQLDGNLEEMDLLKSNHEEDVQGVMAQMSGLVNVEMDCAHSVDLNEKLSRLREQCGAVVLKNKTEAESWFQSKVDSMKTQVTVCSIGSEVGQTEIDDLKRIVQDLTLELQLLETQNLSTERDEMEVNERYSVHLSRLQQHLDSLEEELLQLCTATEQQAVQYLMLLDIKTRLEREIAEYRRLLDGGGASRKSSSNAMASVTSHCAMSNGIAFQHVFMPIQSSSISVPRASVPSISETSRETSSNLENGGQVVGAAIGEQVTRVQKVFLHNASDKTVQSVQTTNQVSTGKHCISTTQISEDASQIKDTEVVQTTSSDVDVTNVNCGGQTASKVNEEEISIANDTVQVSSEEAVVVVGVSDVKSTGQIKCRETEIQERRVESETKIDSENQIVSTVHDSQIISAEEENQFRSEETQIDSTEVTSQMNSCQIETPISGALSVLESVVQINRVGNGSQISCVETGAQLCSLEINITENEVQPSSQPTEVIITQSEDRFDMRNAEHGEHVIIEETIIEDISCISRKSDAVESSRVESVGPVDELEVAAVVGDAEDEGQTNCEESRGQINIAQGGDLTSTIITTSVVEMKSADEADDLTRSVVEMISTEISMASSPVESEVPVVHREYRAQTPLMESEGMISRDVQMIDHVSTGDISTVETVVVSFPSMCQTTDSDNANSMVSEAKETGIQVKKVEGPVPISSAEHGGLITNVVQISSAASDNTISSATGVAVKVPASTVEIISDMRSGSLISTGGTTSVGSGGLISRTESGYMMNNVVSGQMITSAGSGHMITSAGSGHMITSAGSGHMITSAGSGHMITSAGSGHMITSAGSGQMITSAGSGHMITSAGSGGSEEWMVYGGGTGRLSGSGSGGRLSGPGSGGRLSGPGSGGRLSGPGSGGRLSGPGSGGRLSGPGSGGRLSGPGSGGRLSGPGRGHKISGTSGGDQIKCDSIGSGVWTHVNSESVSQFNRNAGNERTGRLSSAGSGEWKVYSRSNGQISKAGSGGRISSAGSGDMISSAGSGGRLSSAGSGHMISSAGSGGRLSSSSTGSGGSGHMISSAGTSGQRISSTQGGVRISSGGSRVITSSGGPASSPSRVTIRNTGSGGGGGRERISVCKMAALSISAAVKEREKAQEVHRESYTKQVSATSPQVQRWVRTSVEETVDNSKTDDDTVPF
ncbi:cell wall protein IFF6 isoform X1 [Salmo salar]|uniref:Cell wall protein IFF6 isoform X1 n=1 Tax=Salmo salar TaxID=8030 RepID=A0ABM3EIR4_SALSA|nr:cell wall protein IFF6 isoform X1 [Salmo salar]